MITGKRTHPLGQLEIELLERKFKEYPLEYSIDLIEIQLHHVDRNNRNFILLLKRETHIFTVLAGRLLGVEQHDKGLVILLQLAHNALLSRNVAFALNVRDGTVARDQNADR